MELYLKKLGFYYIGPIDGHNLNHLLPILKNARDHSKKGPVLIHVVTKKGKGYTYLLKNLVINFMELENLILQLEYKVNLNLTKPIPLYFLKR